MGDSHIDVHYAAELARLNLTEEEVTKFQSQLSQVLAYVDQLKAVNVDGIEPMAHPHPMFNVVRPDEPRDGFNAEQALANAPSQARDLFIVPKIVE